MRYINSHYITLHYKTCSDNTLCQFLTDGETSADWYIVMLMT